MNLNNVVLCGNLTADPEMKYIPSGKAVATMRMAVNNGFGDKQDTLFISVTVWGKMAENVAEFLKKGSNVGVVGRLKLDMWEKDGAKQSKISVVANSVQFGKKLEENK